MKLLFIANFLSSTFSQELLAAVENERNLRSRRNARHEDYEMNIDNSYGDDSDFGECIMRHFAAAARRARYVERRGRPRSSGIGPPLVLLSVPPGDLPLPDVQHMRTTSPEECQTSSYEFSEGDSPTFSTLRSVVPEVVNVEPNFVSNRDGCNKTLVPARTVDPSLKVHKDQAPLNFLLSRSLLNRNFLWLLPDIRNQSQKVPEDLKRSYLPTISQSENWEEEFNVRGMQSPNENAGESVHDMSSPESPRVHSTFPSELDISLVQCSTMGSTFHSLHEGIYSMPYDYESVQAFTQVTYDKESIHHDLEDDNWFLSCNNSICET
ncbi:hypothetical protein TEA_013296 [Camellia sinensis var. sinensis]|uniref:Uncharacterized protein n=1 Tax=Camellia sinensis var. sinensis TaxID=542762 RepID=A0A4S4DMI2_CAMSN|nr:hypothetical protein TEA_013296 [Camellia sinensis var. sinensis]